MSADNWRTCPRCRAREEAAIEAGEAEAAKAYGKVPAWEWKEMTLKAEKRRAALASLEETLREDYELGIYDRGEFSVSYRAGCSKCGFGYEFKHTEVLRVDP